MNKLTESATGTFVIAATPFAEDGMLDLESARSMTDFYRECGASGMTILGVMGEAPKLSPDESLQCIEEAVRFPNFSVEMETGTGKTYVYLRTALELHRRYGLRKFIVVVPSVAVREGVLKSLKITQDHLRGLYDNVPYRFTVYDSRSIGKVRQFAQSDCVELLIMTIDSFNNELTIPLT